MHRPTARPTDRPLAVLGLGLAALVAGCGPDDPQLAMCQEIAGKLVADIADWDDVAQDDTPRGRDIDIAYSTEGGASGTIECRYPIDRNTDAVATAPGEVILNGRRLGTRELLAAGTKASGEVIADTAGATAERARELAEEGGERAREAALEATKALQERLER